jgi:hypothetical protein
MYSRFGAGVFNPPFVDAAVHWQASLQIAAMRLAH